VPEVSDTGHIVLDGTERTGEADRVWYRGPLVPRAVDRRPPEAVHVADQLRRVAEDGRIELGQAAAFELGRLLAISAPSVVAALREWRRGGFTRRRGTNVGAASLLGVLLEQWGTALAGASAETLGYQLLTVVGSPEVAENVVPGRPSVDPLPELDFLADPARTVATGFALKVGEVRSSFAGFAKPTVTTEQLSPMVEVGFDKLSADPSLLGATAAQLQTTVGTIAGFAQEFAPPTPDATVPHGRTRRRREEPPPEPSAEDLFPGARPGGGPPADEPPRSPARRRRRRG
jgi:hypothetical protein